MVVHGQQAEQVVVVLGDRLAWPVLVDRAGLELLIGPSELHRDVLHACGGSNLEVRCMPAARPLAAITRAILAGRLVDHLVSQHRRTLRPPGFGRAPVVGVQDQLGVVIVLLGGGEDLVRRGDLVRVQHPLAVEAQGRGPAGDLAVPAGVADLQVGAVDGLQVTGARGDQDAHQDVVVGVRRVPGRLLADHQRLHVDRGHEVRGPEDDRLQPRRGGGDLFDVHQPPGVLDLGLDADPAHRQAHRLLDLGEQQVQRDHLPGVRPPSAA